jgi:cytosine deaminase
MDKFMQAAFDEAKKGLKEGGIPIGSVLVKKGRIIGRGHNMRVQNSDPTAHAEIECLRNTGRIGSYKDTVLYSTLSPCYLCTGAALLFKIPKVVMGENKNFRGGEELMRAHGVEVVNLQDPELIRFFGVWMKKNPRLWDEDVGELRGVDRLRMMGNCARHREKLEDEHCV